MEYNFTNIRFISLSYFISSIINNHNKIINKQILKICKQSEIIKIKKNIQRLVWLPWNDIEYKLTRSQCRQSFFPICCFNFANAASLSSRHLLLSWILSNGIVWLYSAWIFSAVGTSYKTGICLNVWSWTFTAPSEYLLQ